MIELHLSTAALEDHLSRLYLEDGDDFVHVDLDGARIERVTWRSRRSTILATEPALRDLLADAEYQREIASIEYDRSNVAQWQRVERIVGEALTNEATS